MVKTPSEAVLKKRAQPYCGIGKPKYKGQKRGTMKECTQSKQIRFWGLKKVDSRIIDRYAGLESAIAKHNRLISKLIILRVKKTKVIGQIKGEKDEERKEQLKVIAFKILDEIKQVSMQLKSNDKAKTREQTTKDKEQKKDKAVIKKEITKVKKKKDKSGLKAMEEQLKRIDKELEKDKKRKEREKKDMQEVTAISQEIKRDLKREELKKAKVRQNIKKSKALVKKKMGMKEKRERAQIRKEKAIDKKNEQKLKRAREAKRFAKKFFADIL